MSKQKKKSKEQKMGRFGKLYIATAVLTVISCALVVGVTKHFSDSILKLSDSTPIALPTPIPAEAFLNKSSALPFAQKTPKVQTKTEEKNLQDQTASSSVVSVISEAESVPVGLFSPTQEPALQTPASGEILLGFSGTNLTKSKTMGDWRTHNGIDIKTEMTAAVCAAADGIVKKAEYDDMMGYIIVLSHDGNYETVYANLASCDSVKADQKVKAGDYLGAVGDSAVFEKLEPAHLHFELKKDGKYVDPFDYLK